MTDSALPLLRQSPDDAFPRLARFRARHPDPEWIIRSGEGFWQAFRPEDNGETILGGYTLPELMDKLEALDETPP